MLAGIVLHIDPVLCSIAGVHLWWYGLSYALGFLNLFLFLRRRRARLGFSTAMVYDLTLCLSAGVLVGGRAVEVIFYEWPFYRQHPWLIPALWLGGMATHGLLAGGLAGAWLFCRVYRRGFLEVCDALTIPAAFIMGVGRIGNFIDGQIVGSVSDVWWAVKFPDADGFRHPVVLYDGLKNLLLIPILLAVRRRRPPVGTLTGAFMLLYASLRILVDLFREYPTTLLGLATGQSLNIAMSLGGLALLIWRRRAPRYTPPPPALLSRTTGAGVWRPALLASILLFSLTMPSDWTQDVPARYSARHPGLQHSLLYPTIDTTPDSPATSAPSSDSRNGE